MSEKRNFHQKFPWLSALTFPSQHSCQMKWRVTMLILKYEEKSRWKRNNDENDKRKIFTFLSIKLLFDFKISLRVCESLSKTHLCNFHCSPSSMSSFASGDSSMMWDRRDFILKQLKISHKKHKKLSFAYKNISRLTKALFVHKASAQRESRIWYNV